MSKIWVEASEVKIGDKLLKYRNKISSIEGALDQYFDGLVKGFNLIGTQNHWAGHDGRFCVGDCAYMWLVERSGTPTPSKIVATQVTAPPSGRCPHCYSSRCNHNCQTFWSGKT